jgi:hypothetical protein
MRTLAHLLRALGIAWAAELLARAFGDRALPPLQSTPESHQWTASELDNVRQQARYYFVANLIRGSLYLPVLYGLAHVQAWWIFGFITALVAFHVICALVEAYRWSASQIIPASMNTVPFEKPTVALWAPEPSAYFVPKFFESDRLYRSLGFEFVRRVVDAYVQKTQLTSEERKEGQKVRFLGDNGRQGLLEFEAETRQAEGMHLAAALINVPPILALALNDSPWVWWNLPIFAADFLLVLLQRYHRVRVWKVLNRTRKPELEAPEPVSAA